MEKMEYVVAPLEAADLPTLSRFIYASNLQQATNRFLFLDWPNETAQISFYMTGMEQSFKDPSNEMFKAVDKTSGEILATLILTRKKPEKVDAVPGPPKGIEGLNTKVHAVLREAIGKLQKDMEEVDHLVLSSIFVRPSNRNQGIGKYLLQLSLNKAKTANVPLYLCSVPTAHKFYLGLGFHDTSYVEVDLTGWAPEYCGYGAYRLFGMQKSD